MKLGRNEYRHLRDILRFKADAYIELIRHHIAQNRAKDPIEPLRAGGEMGLFLPFAHRGVDMEGIAQTLVEHGSFYPSIHLAWHFEETDFEYARMIYMQSSLTADYFKGGWTATWESTGGPQQFSGGKAWDIFAAQKPAGFTVDEGTITQLMLSYLAGGYRVGGGGVRAARSQQPADAARRAGRAHRAGDGQASRRTLAGGEGAARRRVLRL
jgi:beta-galactosidase